MKNFFLKVRIVSEFIISFGLGYFTFTLSLPTFPTVVMGFLAVFFFFQTLGLIDKLNGYGQYNTNPKPEHHQNHPNYGHGYSEDDESEEEEEPTDDELTEIEDSSDDDIFLSDDDDDIFINGSDY